MLDLKFVRTNADRVKQGLDKKGFDPKIIDEILPLAEDAAQLQAQIETLRAERNQVAKQGQAGVERGREIKQTLNEKESRYDTINSRLSSLLLQVPNLPDESVPVGEGESANRVIKTVGEKPDIAEPYDHVIIGEKLDLIDIARGVKVAESRFAFLKGQAVLIEFGLVRLAMDICQKHGFTPMLPPLLVNEKTVMGTGYLPHGADEVYKTQDDLYLIGTSELALVGYHQDEVIDTPKRYVGFSSCFRREAGSYGKDTKGILRQHQFDKVEMVSLVKPEESNQELQKILAIEEEIMEALELPYHILEIGTGDLGIQAAKKYDVEAWLPGQNTYRETHSCSNTTDFQTRRLNIRYKAEDGINTFVHALNGTAIAIGRILISLLENGQQDNGTVLLPKKLATYVGFEEIN